MPYYTYILASRTKRLYIGVTNDLERRVWEHKTKVFDGFTEKYNVCKLVYYETLNSIRQAIEREKQLKGWLRQKKIALIESTNREWDDMAEDWYPENGDSSLRSE